MMNLNFNEKRTGQDLLNKNKEFIELIDKNKNKLLLEINNEKYKKIWIVTFKEYIPVSNGDQPIVINNARLFYADNLDDALKQFVKYGEQSRKTTADIYATNIFDEINKQKIEMLENLYWYLE